MAALRCSRLCNIWHTQLKASSGRLFYQSKRHMKRYEQAWRRELFLRRQIIGPDIERHPSAYGIWSYDAEIFSFGKRLGEDFNEEILKQAFLQKSYIEAEEEKKKALGITGSELKDNTELAQKGEEVASRYIKAFLRYSYPYMFEEFISALHDYLLSEEVLWYVSSNLGMKDLMFTETYPPPDECYPVTLLAVIGALAESQTIEQAEYFVKDFIITNLIGKDINEIWDLFNPMGALVAVLKAQGREPPEPRLLWQSGAKTMMSLYHVGIYSDKQLLGRSPGETVEIAEELAARDALNRIMGTSQGFDPLPVGQKVKVDYDKRNSSLEQLMKEIETDSQEPERLES